MLFVSLGCAACGSEAAAIGGGTGGGGSNTVDSSTATAAGGGGDMRGTSVGCGNQSTSSGMPPSDGWLRTSGNAILNSDGTRFHGKGVSIPDQRGDEACVGAEDPDEENLRIDE